MAELSIGRVLVEAQKRITTAHRALLKTPVGPLVNAITPGQGVLVLHTTGRKSGKPRETVLSYFDDGDDRIVIASDGGAAKHPDWFANLSANADIAITIDGERTHVRAAVVDDEDRPRLWRRAVQTYPGYALYQRRAERQIPVVRLTPR